MQATVKGNDHVMLLCTTQVALRQQKSYLSNGKGRCVKEEGGLMNSKAVPNLLH